MMADAYLGGHLILKPVLALPVCGALAAVLAAALLWTWLRWRQPVSGRRRAVLILLRIGLAIAALLLVLRPEIAWEGRQEVRGSVAFLVDATRSMGIADEKQGTGNRERGTGEDNGTITRTEAVRLAFLSSVKPYTELSNSCVIGAFAFGTDLRQINNLAPSPEDPRTDIGQALDALAARTGNRLVAAVVVSDGRVNLAGGPTPEEAAKALAARGVRVHTVGVGSTQPTDRLCDLAIRDLRAPGRVFAGNRAAVRGIVSALGLAGRPVKLTLTVNGKPVEERVLTPKSNLLVEEVAFTPMLETPGLARIGLEAAPVPGELNEGNNRAQTATRVEPGGVRVLYLESEIRPEGKFVARALADAKEIDLDRRILLGTSAAVAAPAAKDLGGFDVVVLGDMPASALPADVTARLVERLRAGDLSLLVLGGSHAFGAGGWAETPLADVLPFAIRKTDPDIKGPIRFTPTAAGLAHFILGLEGPSRGTSAFAAMPLLAGASGVGAVNPAARVLAESATGQPLLAVREFGKGRLAALTVDTTWTWVLSEGDPQGPEHHRRFWRQLILWLAGRDGRPHDDVWVVTDRLRYTVTDAANPPAVQVVAHATAPADDTKDAAPPRLQLAAPDGRTEDVPLSAPGAAKGDWRATLRPTAAGAYTLKAQGRAGGAAKQGETQFFVEVQDLEMTDLLAGYETLKRVAAAGGGTFRTLDGLGQLIGEISADRQPVYEPQVNRRPLAEGGIFLAILMALFAAEWGLRRVWGLA